MRATLMPFTARPTRRRCSPRSCRSNFVCLGFAVIARLRKLCSHVEMIKPVPGTPIEGVDREWCRDVLSAVPGLKERAGGYELASDIGVRVGRGGLSGKFAVLTQVLNHHFGKSAKSKVLIFSQSVRLLGLIEDLVKMRWCVRRGAGGVSSLEASHVRPLSLTSQRCRIPSILLPHLAYCRGFRKFIGGMSKKARDLAVDDFNKRPDVQVRTEGSAMRR